MSKAIDQRIVEMSFENHKFEKGIKESSSSLKKFADTLSNMGTGKEFSGLDSSVNQIAGSFSILEQIGVGALRRIGEAAVNAGGSLIKSLSVDQLSAGLNKYQQKIESVQTMVSAGYGLEEVEKSMNQLMWFADETSYSFADMTDNMAKFVSAGIDLETSGKAMQGIATWAAHSGKNSQAASIAMFNLSQAIGMGYVDTFNWRSIMNQNMNTVMFKEIAIGVAEATGAIKEGQVTIQNFDTNLKDKWFTNDVLLKTLDQYGAYAEKVKEVQEEMGFNTAKQAMDYMAQDSEKYGDIMATIGNAAFKASQESKSFMDSINATMDAVSTGWMKTYEIIFGTLYEAKENFSALTEVLWTVFAASAETRNEMLQLIKDGGGIKNLFQTVKNVAVALLTPLKAISKAFDQFFPPKTETQWLSIISAMESITRGMIMTEETASKIQRTFSGFFAVVDIGWQVIKLLGTAVWEIAGAFIPLGGSLLETTATIGDFLVGLNKTIRESGVFQYALLGIRIAALLLKQAFTDIVGAVSRFITALWNAENPLDYLGQKLQGVFLGTIDVIKNTISWISGKFTNALTSMHKLLTEKLNIDSEGTLGGILTLLRDFIGFLIGEATEGLKSFGDTIGSLNFDRIATFVTGGVILLFINQLTNLSKSAETLLKTTNSFMGKFSKKLFGTTTKIKDLAYVVGVLAASLFVLSKIPWNELARGLVGMAGALVLFVGAYAALQMITVKSSKALGTAEVVKTSFNLMTLATSIGIMAIAVKTISKVDSDEVWRSTLVVGALMAFIAAYQAVVALISKIPGQSEISLGFAGITFGVLGLVTVLHLLRTITPEDLTSSIGKLGSMLLTIAGIQILFGVAARVGGGNKLTTSILGISVGLLALLGVLKLLSVLKIEDLKAQIANVFLLGGVLAGIQLMFNVAGRIGGGGKFRTNILSAQVGMLAMLGLIKILNTMTAAEIQNGLKALGKMALVIGGLQIATGLAAKLSGGAKLQRILGSVTITMLAFTGLIGLLAAFEDEGIIDTGLITISKMLGIIVAFQLLSSLASKLSSGGLSGLGIMLGMVTALLAVTASLALLRIGDQEALRQASISFGIAVLAIGAMAVGVSTITNSLSLLSTGFTGLKAIVQILLPGLATLALIVVATMAFFEVVKNIEVVEWDALGQFIVGMGALTGLIAAFTLLAKTPEMVSGGVSFASLVPGFAAMAAAVVATSGMFFLINQVLSEPVDWNSFGQFIIGLGVLGAFSAAMILLTPGFAALGASFLPALGGVVTAMGGLAIVLVSFVALAALMEDLFSMSSDPDFLVKGIEKLTIVAEGIGKFFGSIIGGFNAGVMISYGESLVTFVEAISKLDPGTFESIKTLTSLLESLYTFSKVKNDSAEQFAQQLSAFTEAFKTVKVSDAEEASKVLKALTPMTENLKLLAEAAKDIPRTGGFIGAFLGDNDIDTFGLQLKGFLRAIWYIPVKNAEDAAETLAALAPMTENLKLLADAAKDIPNTGGFIGAFMGNNDIDTFGLQLKGLVDIFTETETMGKISAASVNLRLMATSMLPALKKFSDLSNELGDSGGVKQFFTGNTTLSEFGREIAKFIQAFNGMDFGYVEPATKAIATIVESFNVIGKDVMDNAAESFHNNKEPFLKEIVLILDEVTKTVDTQKPIIVSGITSIFDSALKDSKLYKNDFSALGSDIISGLSQGLEKGNKKYSPTTAIKRISSSVVSASKAVFQQASPSKVFASIGEWNVKGLAQGMTNETGTLVNAGVTVSKALEASVRDTMGVHSLSTIYTNITEWVGKSLGVGLENSEGFLTKLSNKLGINIGDFTIKGAVESIAGGEGAITSGITSLLDLLTAKPGTVTEAAATETGSSIGDGVTSAFQDSLKDSKSGLGGSKTKDIVKSALEQIQNELEGEKYYGRLSLEEELAAYEKLRLVKGQTKEDYAKIDREVYRLVKDIYESQLSYIDEVTKAEQDAKEKREELYRDYMANQTSIIEESEKKLADLQSKYDTDTTSAKKAARDKELEAEERYHERYNEIAARAEEERDRARKDYASKQKSINEKLLSDIDAQNKAYENAVKSRADAIYNSYSLFSKVDEDPEVTGEELLENLRDQGAALSEWQQSLEELAKRGVGDALIEELQKMGPSSKAQLKALLSLTNEQLTEYVGLFEGKYVFARTKAEAELSGLKDSTEQAIKDLNKQAEIDLDDLQDVFRDSMASINDQMYEDLGKLKEEHRKALADINSDLQEKLDDMKQKFEESSTAINTDTAEKLSKLEKDYNTSLTTINKDTEKKLEELKTKFEEAMKSVKAKTEEEFKALIADNKTKLELLNADTKALLKTVEETHDASGQAIVADAKGNMQDLQAATNQGLDTLNRNTANKLNEFTSEFERSGYQAASGFADGIYRGSYLSAQAAMHMASQAVRVTKSMLDERSPSKVFEGIGRFAGMGFANGMIDMVDRTKAAAKEMAEGPIAAVSQALANLDTETNIWEPVIAPVLDLSNINKDSLDGILGRDLDLAFRSARLANEINQNGSREAVSTTVINNNFDLTGLTVRHESDIDDIATKLHQKQQSTQRGRGIRVLPTGR